MSLTYRRPSSSCVGKSTFCKRVETVEGRISEGCRVTDDGSHAEIVEDVDADDTCERQHVVQAARRVFPELITEEAESGKEIEQPFTHTVTFSTTSGWVAGEYEPSGEPYRKSSERTETPCPHKPDDLDFMIGPIATTETPEVPRFAPPLFERILLEERRTVHTTTRTQISYEWAGTSWESTIKTTETVMYREWTRASGQRPCPSDAGRLAGSGLMPGVRVLDWGTQRTELSIPEGSSVQLEGRQLDSGEHAAVFTVAGGPVLVVTTASLGSDSGEAVPNDPTLGAIADSLREPEVAEQTTIATASECADAEPSAHGVSRATTGIPVASLRAAAMK